MIKFLNLKRMLTGKKDCKMLVQEFYCFLHAFLSISKTYTVNKNSKWATNINLT